MILMVGSFHLHHVPFLLQCGRSVQVLQQTYTLVERALSLDASNAELSTEAGYELLLQKRPREAMKCYRNAMKLDETSVAALTGIASLHYVMFNFFIPG